jgi:autotransporter-associated beta strand protein
MRTAPLKLLLASIWLLVISQDLYASKVTVDADGGAGYTSLDAVLTAIQANTITPDTIEMIGSDQDSYTWSIYVGRFDIVTLVIRSTQTSPDLFPIVTQSSAAISWGFFQSTNFYFENLILSNGTTGDQVYAWTNAQSSGKTLSFKKCIIKDHSTDYFLDLAGGSSNTSIFENCLFEGNAKIFSLNYWGGTPTITLTNCTFDNNTELFSADINSAYATNVALKNCIFSNNTAIFPTGGVLKGKTTYSLTSESTTGYGTSCVSNSNPSYVTSSRNNPTDWMIQSGSPAINIGTSTGAPSTDISGYSRSSPDAGCWENQAQVAYYWDTSSTTGYQVKSGTWGTSNYWNLSPGTGTPSSWPGSGYPAIFAGADGNYTITVSGTQYVDSVRFENSGYILNGGTSLVVSKKLSGTIFGFTPPWAAGYDSAKAFDGNTSTFCDDNSTGTGYTGIDLGSGNAQLLAYIRYYPRSGYLSRMTGGKFQGSNDNSTWTDLYTIPSDPTLAWQMVTVSNTTAWRYLRYLGPANGHCNVSEVEFYGMGSIYVESAKDDTIGTVLTGNSGIRKYGAGTVTLTGTNTYTGPTEIYLGRVQVGSLANGGSNSLIGASSNSAANLVFDGGNLRYTGSTASCDRLFTLGTSGGAIYSSGGGGLTFSNTGSIAYSGSGTRLFTWGGQCTCNNVFAPVLADGTGGVTSLTINSSGSGTLSLTGNNTYTGATTITAGTLSIGNGGTTGAISNSSIIDVTSTLLFNRSDNYTYTGVISGAGAITKQGAGTVTLSGNLTHSGLTTVNAGTLRLTGTPTSTARKFVINSGATISVIDRLNLSPIPAGVTADWITINGGTLSTAIASGQNYGANRGFTLGASGGTINIPYTDNTNIVEIQGVITGSGALAKTGIGVLSLSATNTFTGGVTVSGGTLRTLNTTALGNIANTITVNNGGCIDVYGYNLQAYTNNITINGQKSSDTGALANFGSDSYSAFRKIALGSNASIGCNGGRFDFGRGYSGTTCITGNGYTLTKIGSNLVAILADGSNIGAITINAGTLRLEVANAAATAPITVNSGAVLESWNSLSFTNNLTLNSGALGSAAYNDFITTWSGTISLSGANSIISNGNNTTTLSGAISGTGSLAKYGAEGVFILSGNSNSYSGGTTVSGSTLRITNTSGSATGTGTVTVGSSGILEGTGSVSGATTVNGQLNPGVSGTGKLTFGTNLTFSSGATYNVQLNGTTSGSGYDQAIMSSGTLTLGSATLSLTFGYAPTINDAYTIIDNQGSNAVSGTFSGLAQGATKTVSYNGVPYDCQISYTGGTGNDVVLTVLRISAEDYAKDWGFSQSILLNTTSTGSNVSGNVLNFPVLLRLNPSNFEGFSNVQSGGKDLRFAKTNGAKLSYEIERWRDFDNDADSAEIWVKIDTVYGNNKTQTFLMYWGKSDAADSSNGSKVFDTTNSFVGVWHLGETGNSNVDGYAGSTYNAAHCQGTNLSSGSELSAVIGKGQTLNGTSQYLTVKAAAEPKFDITSAITISAWINVNSWTTAWQAIVTKGDGTWRIHRNNGNGTLNLNCNGLTTNTTITGSTTLSTGTNTWYYVTGVYDGSKLYMYLNGKSDATSLTATGSIGTTNDNVMIGENSGMTGRYFNGSIDEVRIEKAGRDSNWVRLCYENQKSNQTLVSFEDYTTWGFSRNITINTSGITTTNCENFPLLVRLTSSTFDFNQARDSGQDIRFSKSNGIRLPYQIERWNKASSLAEIWVRVDTVYGNNSSQYIKMYWGKSSVSSKSNGANVFDTANGFTGVWHMNDASASASDQTSNALTGTASGNVTYSQTGNIGLANGFDGDGDYFNHGNNALLQMDALDKVTVSAWVKRSGNNINSTIEEGIAGKFKWSSGNYREYCLINNSSSGFRFVVSTDGTSTNETSLASSIVPTNGTWYYVTGMMDATNMYIFTDGVQRNSAAKTAIYGSTNANFQIGIMDDNGTAKQYWNGTIDEVRVEKTNRSADWIKLCYETQKSSPTIVTADSADAFRPLGIRRYGASSSPDSIYVGTNRWAMRFAKNKGGGIKFLSSDTASSNQLDANLFYIVYKGHSSDTGTGTLSLLDSSIVFSRIRQTKSVAGLPFNLDYTITGAGKMFVRVSTTAISSLTGGLAFRIANNATTAYRNISIGSTAATCEGVAHIDSSAGKYDLIMAPYDLWSDANQIETNSKYTGLSGTSWNPPAGKRFGWEFMIDFGHKTLADSTKIAKYIIDYRNSDTLGFYAGTPIMEQAWEEEEKGEWQFNEGSGSSVEDKTGRSHTATISGTPSWTTGKWYTNGIHLGGSDSVTVPHSTEFNGTNKQQTISAWIKPEALLTSSVAILKKYSSAGVGYSFTGGTSGTLRFNMSNGGSVVQLQSSQVLSTGSWYHVAATMFMLGQTDYLALYINGKLDTLRNVELDSYYGTNTSDLVIGQNFTGSVDDVRYYNQLLTEDEIRAIALKGFAPERGMYRLRANNDNTIHTMMHGSVYNRFLPVMQISNYWATALPTYVYVDGVGLTSGTDYYAALDDNRNQLTIGFNRTINKASTIFIDNNLSTGQKENGPTKKMYWGISGPSNEYFWVKNTSGRYFGAASANEFYINWKMNTASPKDGEIWQMRSSVTNPYTYIDTSTGTNLIPGDDGFYSGFGDCNLYISSTDLRSAANVTNSFTYTVEESSQVRIRLRVEERQVGNTPSYKIVTRWTVYPTGQLFRYDSIYTLSDNPTQIYQGWYFDDSTYSSFSYNKQKKRIINTYSQKYPDYVGAILAFKNASEVSAYPYDDDTIYTSKTAYRGGFDFGQNKSSPAKWTSANAPIRLVQHIDFHHAAMNSSSMDSMANGVQCTHFSTRRALSMITGTIDSTSEGDFGDGIISGGDNNGDGFNDIEGAYIVNATSNTVAFKLPAHGDTCRFYPAFRIKNYTAVNKPKYVFLFKGLAAGDTVALLDGYQYNSYVKVSTDELLLQIDSIFCDSVGIYISSDKTLAVELSKFEARSGNRSDTLLWRTESEQGNLGFQLFRRIKPEFYDSITNVVNSSTISESQQHDSDEVMSLFKRKAVNAIDTGWVVVNKELIPGAPSGNSEGPRDYRYVDRNLFNGIMFEYRLVAIDEEQKKSSHGPVAVMPRKIAPAAFMLGANYPNPFVRSTIIRFALPVQSTVSLKIFTIQGRQVRHLLKPGRKYPADYHQVFWDGRDEHGQQCAAGPFIYILEAGKFKKARVMLMIR